MRPFKAVRFSRNSKSGLIRNIINAGIRPAYEKVRSIFPYDKGDRGRSAEPTCERSLLFVWFVFTKRKNKEFFPNSQLTIRKMHSTALPYIV